MKYRDLAEFINSLSEEQKDMDVTIYISGVDEYYPVHNVGLNGEVLDTDVLDDGHPVVLMDD